MARRDLERAPLRSIMGLNTYEKEGEDHVAVSNANGNGSPAGCTARAGEVADKAGHRWHKWRRKKRPIPIERVKEGFHFAKEVGVCRENLPRHPATFS